MNNWIYKIGSYIDPNNLNNIPKGSPNSVIANGLRIAFALAAAISVLIIIFAGLRMVTSSGNPESVNKARNAIIYAAVGLIFCLSAIAIVTFVIKQL
jgi:hypothetical protein